MLPLHQYKWDEWKPAIDIVMGAEKNIEEAIKGLDKLTMTFLGCSITNLSNNTSSTTPNPALATSSIHIQHPFLPQLAELESGLQDAVRTLKK